MFLVGKCFQFRSLIALLDLYVSDKRLTSRLSVTRDLMFRFEEA